MRGRSFLDPTKREPSLTLAFSLWMLTCLLIPTLSVWAQQATDSPVSPEIKKLSDKSEAPEIRVSAARALGRVSPPIDAAVKALSEALQDRSEEGQIRRAAADALGAIGRQPGESDQAIAVLIKTLADRRFAPVSVRAAAARAVGKIFQTGQAGPTGPAIAVLVEALTKPDPDPMVRANAAWALGQISGTMPEADESVKALIRAVKLTQLNVGQTAAQSLVKMYKTAVPELTRQLTGDDDPSFRWNVAWILGEMGKDAKDAVPSLTRLLKQNEEDPNVRGAAAWAIGKIGRDAKAGTSNFRDTVSALADALRNKDNDPNVRSNAAWALGRMGPEVKSDNARFPDISALTDALSDMDPDIRRNAAWAIGQVSPDPKKALSPLATALQDDEDPRVRTEAALALGLIGPLGREEQTRVQALCAALKDNDPSVRRLTAVALGQIGVEAQTAIPNLVSVSHKPKENPEKERKQDRDARLASAEALAKIADSLQINGNTAVIEQLEEVAKGLQEDGYRVYAAQVRIDTRTLRSLLWFNRMKGLLSWIQRYRAPVFVICAYVLFWFFLYWKYPRLVFRINEALKPYVRYKFPKFLGEIPLSYLILGGFFHYRPRVLDAWVAEYVEGAREKFQKKLTVEQREVHVELPAFLDGRAIPSVGGCDLRSCFARKRNCVLIWGEGGAGKTSLACQICKWAMLEDAERRLTRHPMIAVLLELEDFEARTGKDVFIEAVRNQLWYLIDPADPPSEELVEKLLESRRVLVVVDGFSEMSEVNRRKLQPGNARFPAHALVMTSRLEEKPAGVDLTVIKPMRVQGDHLSTFMDAYLVQRKKKVLFSDAEYFDDLGNLSKMVRERDITVLLAKLYAEQMIAAKEATTRELPENIPDLMLEYLNELNRNVKQKKLDDRAVHRAAKTVAWECLRDTCRPMPARIDKVVQRLDGQTVTVEDQLKFLEGSLRLVQTVGAGRDRIRFTLDPLAEYLAALKVMEDLAENEQGWRKFLTETDLAPGAPEAIKGFLLAVRDCCLVKGAELGIPDFVSGELGQRVGLDPRGEKDGTTKPVNYSSTTPITSADIFDSITVKKED